MCHRSFQKFWQIGQEFKTEPNTLLEISEHKGRCPAPDFQITLYTQLSSWIDSAYPFGVRVFNEISWSIFTIPTCRTAGVGGRVLKNEVWSVWVKLFLGTQHRQCRAASSDALVEIPGVRGLPPLLLPRKG